MVLSLYHCDFKRYFRVKITARLHNIFCFNIIEEATVCQLHPGKITFYDQHNTVLSTDKFKACKLSSLTVVLFPGLTDLKDPKDGM